MSDPIPDPTLDEPTPSDPLPAPPTYAEILALLGLPTDARSVVITPESTIAIAGDYPEPYAAPTEES